MEFDNSMYNWDITTLDFEDNNFTNSDRFFSVIGQEEKVATMESRLHATT